MNFDLSEEQAMVRETFARFLDEASSPHEVRKAEAANAVDRELWRGLAELGAFGLRLPESAGGLGLGTFDAAIVME
ncbi:MAG TPA: acyl-CoA dehydrogenase family protein, partial [Reyranella sp.]|nr:acyl-CoA dehydrogenase family protein [Reyranella sp.]